VNDHQTAQLKKELSNWGLLAIGVGAVIGWSWVIYAGPWSTYPGSLGGVIAFIIGGILCSFIGLAYAELTSAMPRAGGDMVFTFEGLGQKWAFVTGICMIMAFVGLVTVETLMFPVILEALGLPLVRSGMLYHFAGESVFLTFIAVSIAINALFAYINHRGVGLAGIVQTITVVVLVLASVFFVVSGVSLGTAANAKPLITSAAGISMVMLMVPSFMSGFNAIPQAAEETNVSPRTIGRLVIATVWACVVFYILIIVGLSFAAPAEIRSGGGVVVLSALTNLFQSNAPRVFVAIAALIGMLTSWNAAYLAGSRLLLAFGRVHFLPEKFSQLHPRFSTPTLPIIIIFLISSLCTLLGTSQAIYVGIVNVLGFCLVLAWLIVSISFLKLRKHQPDLERPYKVPAGKLVGVLAVVLSFIFLLLYTPLNPLGGLKLGELVGLGVLILIALILYIKYVATSPMNEKERAKLMRHSI